MPKVSFRYSHFGLFGQVAEILGKSQKWDGKPVFVHTLHREIYRYTRVMPSESPQSQFRQFTAYVGKHWVELMSGGIITVALALTERLSGRSIPFYVYLIVIFVFILLACFRAWVQKNAELTKAEEELAKAKADLDKQKPCFNGSIEMILGGVTHGVVNDYHLGCEIMVLTYFANNHPAPTSIVDIHLDITIGEKTYNADLRSSVCRISFSDVFRVESLQACLDSPAAQGKLFRGRLHFSFNDVLIKDTDQVRVQKLVIKDTFGIDHEIRPSGDGIVELYGRESEYLTWHGFGMQLPRLSERFPPLILPSQELSDDLKALLRKVFGPSRD
jgi:hypothetical protein